MEKKQVSVTLYDTEELKNAYRYAEVLTRRVEFAIGKAVHGIARVWYYGIVLKGGRPKEIEVFYVALRDGNRHVHGKAQMTRRMYSWMSHRWKGTVTDALSPSTSEMEPHRALQEVCTVHGEWLRLHKVPTQSVKDGMIYGFKDLKSITDRMSTWETESGYDWFEEQQKVVEEPPVFTQKDIDDAGNMATIVIDEYERKKEELEREQPGGDVHGEIQQETKEHNGQTQKHS